MDIEVTLLAEEHRAGLHALLTAVNWGRLAQELAQGGLSTHSPYVALSDGKVVGWLEGVLTNYEDTRVSLYPPPQTRINYVLTAPSMRRAGIGSALLHRFAADAAVAERSFVVLWADEREPGARLAFFAACGFEPIPDSGFLGVRVDVLLANTAR
ncbi:GNAT family N-acetyltransferase [Wenjunlia tyrosinilytica]|uniref:GNAT family N-acetyltransferase n=1 Tax=Wenjunlia tyrosinilytica TaxID=1544741 RepID=UPI00166D672E|nr:GNAT family N-acetyltransferase [Wenjunlia tyrosinilytica]